jgi:hypothetical protein
MHQEAALIRRSLRTPRAAGINFSLLLIASQVLIRLSIPSDPLVYRWRLSRRGLSY